jgi:hypothetical protein
MPLDPAKAAEAQRLLDHLLAVDSPGSVTLFDFESVTPSEKAERERRGWHGFSKAAFVTLEAAALLTTEPERVGDDLQLRCSLSPLAFAGRTAG